MKRLGAIEEVIEGVAFLLGKVPPRPCPWGLCLAAGPCAPRGLRQRLGGGAQEF